jgi:serine phosphatase RsbU (regulator of sigma subunit)
MAQIRSTIRAYAVDDADPIAIFRKVDAFFEAFDLDQLVTVLYFLVDSLRGSVVIANAGHLSPLLTTGKSCEAIATPVGLPFGVGQQDRSSTTVELARGDALIAVTDGLVERRGEDIDDGVAKLVAALSDTDGWSAKRLLDQVVSAAAAERQHDDDVTVLVLRRL